MITLTIYNQVVFARRQQKDLSAFQSSWNLSSAYLSTTHRGYPHCPLYVAERQAGKLWIPIFIVFGLTRPGIESESTSVKANLQCYVSNHCFPKAVLHRRMWDSGHSIRIVCNNQEKVLFLLCSNRHRIPGKNDRRTLQRAQFNL